MGKGHDDLAARRSHQDLLHIDLPCPLLMILADLVVGRAKLEESKRGAFTVSGVGSPTKPLTLAVGPLLTE